MDQQPWEMTRYEFSLTGDPEVSKLYSDAMTNTGIKWGGMSNSSFVLDAAVRVVHKGHITAALKAGIQVPDEVMGQYPELAEKKQEAA